MILRQCCRQLSHNGSSSQLVLRVPLCNGTLDELLHGLVCLRHELKSAQPQEKQLTYIDGILLELELGVLPPRGCAVEDELGRLLSASLGSASLPARQGRR